MTFMFENLYFDILQGIKHENTKLMLGHGITTFRITSSRPDCQTSSENCYFFRSISGANRKKLGYIGVRTTSGSGNHVPTIRLR